MEDDGEANKTVIQEEDTTRNEAGIETMRATITSGVIEKQLAKPRSLNGILKRTRKLQKEFLHMTSEITNIKESLDKNIIQKQTAKVIQKYSKQAKIGHSYQEYLQDLFPTCPSDDEGGDKISEIVE